MVAFSSAQCGDGAIGSHLFPPPPGGWSDDFSAEPVGRQAFFIHEMTHVWQTQAKGRFYLLLMRHPWCRYGYTIEPGKPFQRYGVEQQAEIVRNVFLAARGASIAAPPRAILPFA
jgi:hypothetical protein